MYFDQRSSSVDENAFQSNDERKRRDNKIQTILCNTEKINDEVKSLESKVETLAEEKSVLKRRVNKLTEDLDEMEQYSRRSCLIFVGTEETGDIPEDTDKAILDVCNTNLGLSLMQEAIDRPHRLGPVCKARIEQGNAAAPSPRPIIVKLTNCHNRSIVFSNKRKLNRETQRLSSIDNGEFDSTKSEVDAASKGPCWT